MLKKGVFLYYLTAGWVLLMAAIGLMFLFSSMKPTADVKAQYQPRVYSVPIESWEPGEVRNLRIAGRPVVIWRSDLEEIATAMAQAEPDIPLEDWTEFLNNGSLARELGPEAYARMEWFVVSPISTAGFGCIVLTKAGDFDGFFDPCRGTHFDTWGRPQRGPARENLTTHPISFTEDRQSLVLEISRLSVPR
ncbi:ubiquinol-Cytochrome c reductase, iron-sulfur subunit [Rhodobacteraceae bacterium KLH11]|nr:ubiquinol-Cytochrome c reductase, iron-sulfur subunit [Rhodobacteraceae bacterium KLH11]